MGVKRRLYGWIGCIIDLLLEIVILEMWLRNEKVDYCLVVVVRELNIIIDFGDWIEWFLR